MSDIAPHLPDLSPPKGARGETTRVYALVPLGERWCGASGEAVGPSRYDITLRKYTPLTDCRAANRPSHKDLTLSVEPGVGLIAGALDSWYFRGPSRNRGGLRFEPYG